MSMSPELGVTNTTFGDFRAPITGAARWFVLGPNDLPVSVCRSEGQTIVERARSELNGINGMLGSNLPDTGVNVTDAWRPKLVDVLDTLGVPSTASLQTIMARSMDTWTDNDMALVTALLVWCAFYRNRTLKYANGSDVPLQAILLPGNTTAMFFPGSSAPNQLTTVDAFEPGPDAARRSQDLTPRCAGPTETLPPVGENDLPIGPVDPHAAPPAAPPVFVSKAASNASGYLGLAGAGVLTLAGVWAKRKKLFGR